MKKWLYGCIAATLTALILAAPLVWLLRGSGITRANFNRIEVGMSREEVCEIFGCPPGDYRWDFGPRTVLGVLNGQDSCMWHGYEGDFMVNFSRENGQVLHKQDASKFYR